MTARSIPTNYVSGRLRRAAVTSDDIYPMRVASAHPAATASSRSARQAQSLLRARRVPRRSAARTSAASTSRRWTPIRPCASCSARSRGCRRGPISPARHQRPSSQQFLTRYYLGQETNAAQAGELAQYRTDRRRLAQLARTFSSASAPSRRRTCSASPTPTCATYSSSSSATRASIDEKRLHVPDGRINRRQKAKVKGQKAK